MIIEIIKKDIEYKCSAHLYRNIWDWLDETEKLASYKGYEIVKINNGWLTVHGDYDNVTYHQFEPSRYDFLLEYAQRDAKSVELLNVTDAKQYLNDIKKNGYCGHGEIKIGTMLAKILNKIEEDKVTE